MAEQVQVTTRPNSELLRLYPNNQDLILIGGQALATWVDVFGMPVPSALEGGVTRDMDFYGTRKAAEEHYRLLSDRGLKVQLIFPAQGDVTPNCAKIVVRSDATMDVTDEIDYLGTMCGFHTVDEDRLRTRAIPIQFESNLAHVLVMHPVDCLKSRIHNLASLPAKRTPKGIAQALLSIDVMKQFLKQALRDHASTRQIVYPVVEAIIRLGLSRDATRVFHEFGIDPLTSIEPDTLPPIFAQRWEQVIRYAARRRFGRKNGRCHGVESLRSPLHIGL